MPIKFRCQHCRQFLGISRSKAGSIVDCPTCGRSIRVPSLEGELEPIPEPKLDLNDSNLASALDQLASIGELESIEDVEEPASSSPPRPGQSDDPLAPAPLPEPIAVAIPDPADEIAPVLVEPPPPSKPAQRVAQPTTAPDDVSDIIASLAPPPTPVSKSETAPPSLQPSTSFRWRLLLAPPFMATVAATALLFFALGYFVGNGRSLPEIQPTSTDNSGQQQPVAATTNGNTSSTTPAVRGRITYETDSGTKRVDEGARVIVLPKERAGTAKLAVAGFRSADDPTDFAVAEAALKAIGGNVARVDAEGSFELPLSKPGSYHILVLSHYQSRAESSTPDPQLLNSLSDYFERPDQLLGRLAYRFDQLQYNGTDTIPWDVSFERE